MKPRRVFSLASSIFFVALGWAGRSVIADPPPAAIPVQILNTESYEGVVVGDPDTRERIQRIALEVGWGR